MLENTGNLVLAVGGLGFALLFVLALALIFSPENRQEQRTVDRMKGAQDRARNEAITAAILKQRQSNVGHHWPVIGNLRLLVRHADMEGKETAILLSMIFLGLLATLSLMLLINLVLAVALGALIGLFGTIAYLKHKHQKRITALTRQLPDALELMMRGLRVGHPVGATVDNVGRTMSDPIGREFRILSEQIRHGDYLTDAFADLANRVGQEDVEYLSVAISIQHGSGGNLADVLGTLSKVVRERIVMRRRVRAISSEGRLSAYLLSALPVLIFFSITISSPGYYTDVSDAPVFIPIAVTIVLLVVGNFFALRWLVTFKI
ncbi:tight adherence protein B [Roseovarius lutimaris]|uniref:Tight adherence protein B n=1 Tax=Roseovarius lutimaris TaxID=1005928 RepID=A0A1I4ZJ64_9RHOB|nr:type II secretion system F family protein [Roseovarius lutimaris]SFN50103.1 tight adherence protein B [Roseovarius lutimaris]